MAQNPQISSIFYYFESVSTLANGRSLGRKIGVMQEVLLRKYLMQSPLLAERLFIERSLHGFSKATHKMEFLVARVVDRIKLRAATPYLYGGIEMHFIKLKDQGAEVELRWEDADKIIKCKALMAFNESWKQKVALLRFDREGVVVRLVKWTEDEIEIVLLEHKTPLAAIESKRVGAQRFSATDQLGAGIQTIEKAKQAALVAIDADLKWNKSLKAFGSADIARPYLSVVVLGNGVHWEAKSRHVLTTYVDQVFLVHDSTIIRYCEFVKEKSQAAGKDFLPFYMSYFPGLTKMQEDGFNVSDADFHSLTGEKRPLLEVLESHIKQFN